MRMRSSERFMRFIGGHLRSLRSRGLPVWSCDDGLRVYNKINPGQLHFKMTLGTDLYLYPADES